MTPSQQHAARLREAARSSISSGSLTDALLAGAEALEKLEAINTGEAVTHNMMVAAHFDRVETYFTRMDLHCTRAEAIYERMAKALEGKAAQGRWRIVQFRGVPYFIPVERTAAWDSFNMDTEPGEHTEILPEWAVRVPPGVVITGWER